jgi:hypothetical protein
MVMTSYNPLEHPDCGANGLESLGNAALEGNAPPELKDGLNDRIRSIAAVYNVAVAELVPGGDFPDLLGVSELTSDCLHPNDAGYAIITDAFVAALPSTTILPNLLSSLRSHLSRALRPGPFAGVSGPGPG